ncbi:hypothetical protein R50072_28300 [Simiduia litorea]|uniref:hypothetical protein n=1 Tax=Simiduia litorea TaxID=1435348 RepID=UPI0036F2C200
MSFTSLLALVGDIVAVGGAFKSLAKNPEKANVEQFITFLETRRVLFAQFDQEIKHAVIKSIEEIKLRTEDIRSTTSDTEVRKILARLIKVMAAELDNLWAYDTLDRRGQQKMFMSIQRFRTELAKTLAILCHTYGIDPASSELQQFIINMATVRPVATVAK